MGDLCKGFGASMPGDRRAAPPLPLPRSSQVGVGLSDYHPRSSQIGVDLSYATRVWRRFGSFPLCSAACPERALRVERVTSVVKGLSFGWGGIVSGLKTHRQRVAVWLTASYQLLAAKFSKIVNRPHPWRLLHPTAILRNNHARTCTPSPVMSFATHCLNPGHVRVAQIHVQQSMSWFYVRCPTRNSSQST